MWLACILTLLALGGAWAGVSVGHGNTRFSEHLTAAGGGLLFGISVFWLVPEIAETAGRAQALLLAILVAALLWALDFALTHGEHSAHKGVVWPLLLATAIHSLLDGWSVRFLSVQPLTNIAVMVGLALHKIPEGAAVGWMTRRSLGKGNNMLAAFALCAAAEIFTVVGAFAEPALNASAAALLGSWWSAGVLSVIAGGFLFLGVHAVLPAWRRMDLAAIFLATLLLVGGLTLVRSPV